MRVALLYDIIYYNVTDLFTVQWYCRGIKISLVRKRDLPFSLKTSCCMTFRETILFPTSYLLLQKSSELGGYSFIFSFCLFPLGLFLSY